MLKRKKKLKVLRRDTCNWQVLSVYQVTVKVTFPPAVKAFGSALDCLCLAPGVGLRWYQVLTQPDDLRSSYWE